MASVRRSRFRARETEPDPTADADIGSRTEGSSGTTGYESDLESMTGKGIKHLCSELLELKKASDEDFQRNVYSNYSAFVRIFEEFGGVESEIMELKQHVSTQRKLVEILLSSYYVDMLTDDLKDVAIEDLGICSSGRFVTQMQENFELLDTLLLEQRLDEAMTLLEKETLTLQTMQMEEDCLSPEIMEYSRAISERRRMLADQFALVAEHPRVAQLELRQALSRLCRLGENHRANILLLNFFHLNLQKNARELLSSKQCLHGTYIRELAKCVFSAISQAGRCFVTLYGETSPYTSSFIQWTREETKTFSNNFRTYVKSISEKNGALTLAVEAAKDSISYCSLLKSQNIVLLPKLMELIRPCMEEVLQMHVYHFKKVVRIFTATDNWSLSKFLILGILRDKASLMEVGDKVEYCLLTSSGRKFVTLVQAFADDISPLANLQMGSSVLKGLADLFNEYMCTLESAIPSKREAGENDSPRISSAQTLMQQLSLLVSSSTLVHLSPRIAASIAKGTGSSDNELLSGPTELFSHNELDNWMLSIETAVDQLRGCFCEHFVYGVMSHGDLESAASWCIRSSAEDPVPSLAFQALFVQLRQLEEHAKSIFAVKDGMMEKLLKDIVETVIFWISNNQEFWKNTVSFSSIQLCSCLQQAHLDMSFLVEIAKLGGCFSDDLMVASLDLLAEMEAAFAEAESYPESVVLDEVWASNAAKMAVRKLLEAEAAASQGKEEPVATSEEDLSIQHQEDYCLSDVDSINPSGNSTASLDDAYANYVDDDILTNDYDESGSSFYADMDEGQDASRADSGTDGVCETEGIENFEAGLIMDSEVESVGNLNEVDVNAGQRDISENENLLGETELLEADILSKQLVIEKVTMNPEVDCAGVLNKYDVATPSALHEPQNIAREEILVLESGLLEVDKVRPTQSLEQLEVEGLGPNLQLKSVASLDEYDATATQFADEGPQDIAKKENLLLGAQHLKVFHDLDITATYSCNSGAKISAEVHKDPSDAVAEGTVLECGKQSAIFEGDGSFNGSKELVQFDWSDDADETATSKPQSRMEEDKLLAGKYSEMVLDTILQERDKAFADPFSAGGQEGLKYGIATEGLRKNGKASSKAPPRRRWQ